MRLDPALFGEPSKRALGEEPETVANLEMRNTPQWPGSHLRALDADNDSQHRHVHNQWRLGHELGEVEADVRFGVSTLSVRARCIG